MNIDAESLRMCIDFLSQRNVHFEISHRYFWGGKSIFLTNEELVKYAMDPITYLANYYQVTKEEYLDWHQSNYTVQCAALTKAGKRCKCAAVDGINVEPKDWVNKQGSYCSIHS